jgi:phosphoribosylanthranilate isomerase
MGLTIPVILDSVNNLSDARYAAGMGVDLMSFEVEEGTERYVSPDLYKAITSWLSGIKTVASVSILNPSKLAHIQENYQPDFIQFESIEGISQHDLSAIASIQKITLSQQHIQTIEAQIFEEVSYVFLEASDWIDWRNEPATISRINNLQNILWALPIEKEDIEIIHTLHLKGLALKGGDEQRPGWKDLDQLIDILEALEEN